MVSKPILFSGPMVNAILTGQKRVTRRVVKPQPQWFGPGTKEATKFYPKGCFYQRPKSMWNQWTREEMIARCRYKVGDQLWVKETFGKLPETLGGTFVYRAEEPARWLPKDWKWKPAIFMPRSASRLTLEVEDVGIQELRQLTKKDAFEEGFEGRQSFITYWDSLNTKRGFPWSSNPWVYVIRFKIIHRWGY